MFSEFNKCNSEVDFTYEFNKGFFAWHLRRRQLFIDNSFSVPFVTQNRDFPVSGYVIFYRMIAEEFCKNIF